MMTMMMPPNTSPTTKDDDVSAASIFDHGSVPGRRNNNIVAESDMAAALKGIQDYFTQYFVERKMTFNKDGDDNDDNDINDDHNENGQPDQDQRMSSLVKKVQQNLLLSTKESFCKNLQRAVQPVSDRAYHVFLHRHEMSDDKNQNLDDERKGDAALSPDQVDHHFHFEQEEVADEEYDEEALLDQEAMERARELREQVRLVSQNVKALRKSVLDRAVALGHRQVQLWRAERGEFDNDEDGTVGSDAVAENNEQDMMLEVDAEWNKLTTTTTLKTDQVKDMEQTLDTLIQSLQQANEELPNRMETLQETIATVEHGIVEGAHDFPADITMHEEDRDDEVELDDEEWDEYNPEMKLALLLS